MQKGKLLIDCLHGLSQAPKPDPAHPHRRRYTLCYQRKKGIAKNLWIISGISMLISGAAPAIVASLALATTFVTFCILDETD